MGDEGFIPGLGRSPGEGNGNPLQYSCLRNPMDRGAPRVTVSGIAKSQTQRLNNNKNKTSREKSIKQNYKTFRNTLVILEEKFQNKGLGRVYRLDIKGMLCKKKTWDFPNVAVTKTLCSQCRGPGFHPWLKN